MACHHDNVVVATGSLDGSSKIINSNTGKVLATFNCALEGGKDKEKDEEEGEDSEGTDSVESVGLSKRSVEGQILPTQYLQLLTAVVQIFWDFCLSKASHPKFIKTIIFVCCTLILKNHT